MNMTGNVVSMINIMNDVIAASNNCDLSTIAYDIGRLTRILAKVEPIEVVEASYMMMQHSPMFEALSFGYKIFRGVLIGYK
jgi:hypothetical protein